MLRLSCWHGGGWYERDLHNCTIITCRFVVTSYWHGGGWYERDLHNCTLITCRFVVTIVISDVSLFGMHAGKIVMSITACAECVARYEHGEK